jgi:hypothetical protein
VTSPIPLLAQPAQSLLAKTFGVRAGDNDDLVFVTSDSTSIFLVTIVSSDPYFPFDAYSLWRF